MNNYLKLSFSIFILQFLFGTNTFSQNIELIEKGQSTGITTSLLQAEIHAMPNGHFILEYSNGNLFVLDLKKEVKLSPIKSGVAIPSRSSKQNYFAEYDVYRGNVEVFDGNSLTQLQKFSFQSMLNWYNFTNKEWGYWSAGGTTRVRYGSGDLGSLNFSINIYKKGTIENVYWYISDSKTPNMISKAVTSYIPSNKLIISEDLHYYALLRGNTSFLEVAISGFIEKGQSGTKATYYYLLGDYTNVQDYSKSFFDIYGNFYLAPTSSNEENYKIFNPNINPSAFYAEISASDKSIESIKRLNRDYEEFYSGANFEVELIKQGLDLFKIIILDKLNKKIIHEEELSLGINKPKDKHRIIFLNNPYSNELFIASPSRKISGLFSYKSIIDKYILDHPELKKTSESRVKTDVTVEVSLKIENGVVAGSTVNGLRQGNWLFTGNNGATENWEYKNGSRVDDEYNKIRAKYDEASNQILIGLSGKLLGPILKEYEEKVQRANEFNDILKQSAIIAGGSILGSSAGMDQLNSLNFGVALNQDIQSGTTSNMDAFFNSYQSLSPSNPNFLNNMEKSMGLVPSSNPASSPSNSSATSNASGNGSLLGTWTTRSGNTSITFNSGGKGVLNSKDANNSGSCIEGTVNEFKWTSTDTSIELIYTSASVCGEKQKNIPASDGSKEYSLQAGTLKYLGSTWTK